MHSCIHVGSDPRLYLLKLKCSFLMHLYHLCVDTLVYGSIVFQTCSNQFLRFHSYQGPSLPCSMASQAYIVWYLRCLAAQPFLNVCSGFLSEPGSFIMSTFSLSIRGSFFYGTYSSILQTLQHLIMSLLGHLFRGAKLV